MSTCSVSKLTQGYKIYKIYYFGVTFWNGTCLDYVTLPQV